VKYTINQDMDLGLVWSGCSWEMHETNETGLLRSHLRCQGNQTKPWIQNGAKHLFLSSMLGLRRFLVCYFTAYISIVKSTLKTQLLIGLTRCRL